MKIIRFGELYSIPTSNGVSRPSAVRGEGFHMINMGELFSFDVINEMPMERVFLSDKEQKKYLVKKGDLLFARQSLVAAGAGKCSIVNNILEPTTFESHLIRVRLDETRCCPRYYYYLFKLPDNPIKTIVNQCAQAGIRGSELQKIKVPLPMLAEQRRIASILSTYDNLIENNNKRIRLLEQMAENLYKEWFVRFRFPGHEKAEFENGLPMGWKVMKLDKILTVRYGKDHSKIEDGDIPILGSGGIMRFGNKELYASESVLIPRKGSLNNIMYIDEPFWTVDTMFFTEMKYKNIAKYVYYVLSGIDMESFNSGAALPSMTTNILNHFKVILPSEDVLALFDEKVELLFLQKKKLIQQNTLLSRQRDLLLPRLMSGKLEVNV
jgi:type I restriction enzyme S subunit